MSKSGYEPPSNLKRFVEAGNLSATRTALRIELDTKQLDAHALRQAATWTKSRIRGIFDPYAERAFARGMINDHSQWTEDYYGEQLVYLKTNFSEERFFHLVDIREHLHPYAAPTNRSKRAEFPLAASHSDHHHPPPRPENHDQEHQEMPSSRTPPTLRAALWVGGAIAALAILLLSVLK